MKHFPWMSPYVAFDNNPIFYTDPYGLSAGGPPVTGSENEGDVNGDYTFHCAETSEYDGWYKNIEGPTIRPSLSDIDREILNFTLRTAYMDKSSILYLNQEAMLNLKINSLKNSNVVSNRKMSMPKVIDASLDDDRINFFVLGAGAGANAVTYGLNADVKNIWVSKDVDNIHVHNSGRFYLTYGFSYGKNAADALAEMSISAQIGYGYMENVHPYDDLGAIFENATEFEISYSAGSTSAGMVVGKSKGKNGTVPIYFFFGDYGQGLKTKQKMPMAIPVNIKGGIFSKELKRNVSVKVNAADTGKVIINNPSNNLPGMTMDQIKRMDQILMKK